MVPHIATGVPISAVLPFAIVPIITWPGIAIIVFIAVTVIHIVRPISAIRSTTVIRSMTATMAVDLNMHATVMGTCLRGLRGNPSDQSRCNQG